MQNLQLPQTIITFSKKEEANLKQHKRRSNVTSCKNTKSKSKHAWT